MRMAFIVSKFDAHVSKLDAPCARMTLQLWERNHIFFSLYCQASLVRMAFIVSKLDAKG
jgi:hypothetical protein